MTHTCCDCAPTFQEDDVITPIWRRADRIDLDAHLMLDWLCWFKKYGSQTTPWT